MLSELVIRDLAIIHQLHLRLPNGFVVLTGETGAGKSIILDAVSLVLGGRGDRAMVRGGCDRAYVEAEFELNEVEQAKIAPLLAAEGLDGDSAAYLILGREVRSNGRTVARVNGVAVGATLLKKIGAYLIDIHGQGEHLKLLQPRSHQPLLDAFARLDDEREKLGRVVSQLNRSRRDLAALQQDKRMLAQQIDLLTYQIQEIDAAVLEEGEWPLLLAERTRLANAENLMRGSAETGAILLGVDDETPSVLDMLGQAERTMSDLARLDESQAPKLERLQGAIFELSDLAADVNDYGESLEFNPQRLNEVEARIELITTLKRKYGDTIDAVVTHRDEAAAKLNTLTHSEVRSQALAKQIEGQLRKIGKMGIKLSAGRKVSAEKLTEIVESELADLGMTARFDVAIAQTEAAGGAYVGDRQVAFDKTGIDQIQFLISANPGEPLKPMAKVASGGESARLMLALKTALARVDVTPTLIFDEIDQGIGGRIGDIVGQKLWSLTVNGGHQVIVVTHLPQMAGYGDAHFHVRKSVTDGRTETHVMNLDSAERISELADMLGSSGDHARGAAADILAHAAQTKAKTSVS